MKCFAAGICVKSFAHRIFEIKFKKVQKEKTYTNAKCIIGIIKFISSESSLAFKTKTFINILSKSMDNQYE